MKRAIVLSGGGSKGAYQIGVWKALRKMKIKYDIVTGTSIGSVNGIMMVQKEYHKAKYLWDNISYDDIFNVKFPKKGNKVEIYKKYAVEFLKNGGMETSKIYQFMNNAYNKKKFYKSNIDYGIVTFNVSNMKPRILNKEEMKDDLIQYVLASSTCFPAFQMTQIDDDHYVDGGYYNNLPIDTAIDLGADEIIAVDLGTVFFQKKIKSKKVKITYISPRNDIGSFLVFDKNQAKKSMKYGYNDAMKVYKQLDGNKYTFNKGELFKNYEKYSSKFINNLKYSLIESGTTKKIVETLRDHLIYVEKEENITGYVGFFVVDLESFIVKKKMVKIEDDNDLGRLFDIDVISCDGKKVSRHDLNLPGRKCLLCDNDAFYCSRSRNHPVDELVRKIKEILNEYFKRTNK